MLALSQHHRLADSIPLYNPNNPNSNGPWSRTSQLRIAPYMPNNLFTNPLSEGLSPSGMGIVNAIGPSGYPLTPGEIASAAATAAAAGNAGGGAGVAGGGKKRMETFFGPDVGVDVDAEKGWLNRGEGGNMQGQGQGQEGNQKLPLSVVKDWIEKSKSEESVHPTTTLQALVNLKRPTLALHAIPTPSPDTITPTTTNALSSSTKPKHTLRFLYDSSAPQVKITLTLHHRVNSPAYTTHGPVEVLYSGVHQSGFGKVWELPKELGMDLQVGMDRERPVVIPKRGGGERESQDGDSFDSGDEKDLKGGVGNRNSTGGGNGATTTEDTTNVLASDAVIAAAQADSQGRRRFGIFGRRRNNRSNDIEAGMNSIELQNTNTAGGGLATETTPDEEAKKAADEDGIRVLIRLEGLDMDGKVLTNANAQLNHILVTGALVGAAVAVGETAVVVEGGGDVATVPVVETEKVEEDKPEEDGDAGKKWVWMVKVVRREALIGTYTFLLKEIYGLSASSGVEENTSEQINSPTYPPTSDQHQHEDAYASTSNECIVCLTNPRDVVLLPCRHLVVCRECAVGMVEFGAGGKVARREDVVAASGTAGVTAEGADETANAAGSTGAATATPVPAPAPSRERRRKKAKGWFCPVCRQSYTSLLRLALPSTLTPAETDEAVEAALSRVPSRASHHTLRRISSRASIATLPVRGQVMLESMLRDEADDEELESTPVTAAPSVGASIPAAHSNTTTHQEPPQFVLADEVDAHPNSSTAIGTETEVEKEAKRNAAAAAAKDEEFKEVPL